MRGALVQLRCTRYSQPMHILDAAFISHTPLGLGSVFSCSNVFSLHKCRSQMGSMGSHFGLSKAAQTGVQQHKMSSSLFRSHLEATSFL